MKLRSYLVFLVLALVCISRGDDEATTAPENRPEVSQTHTDPPPTSAASTPSESVNKSTYEVTPATTPSTSPEENTTDAWYFTNNITNELTNETGEEGSGSSSSSSSSSTVPQTTTPGGTTPLPAPDQSQHHTSWDRPALKDQVNSNEPSTPSTANGTRLQAEEKSSNGDAPQEQSNGLQGAPTGLQGAPTGLQGAPTGDADPPLDSRADNRSSPDLFFDTTKEEQQNENNNNPFTCSSLPFVEINLEEAPWCDQLLSSPQAPSSVLPFPPFSFSSSS
ncbi:putative protein TPRXL isoform X2 [Sphaeramia orbicularis]|uniref:putative protein TPRXL isoform X2 n=1 Tax=Sphaeramia orbicularis TaxID=375764 RepID=UPI00117C3545|nr:putative protein TPRXL isoform X2 [Sphaeramia orbicularis]